MRPLATMLALVTIFASLARAQKPYEDAERGFMLRPPKEWNQIPISPSERLVVAHWSGKRQEQAKKSVGNTRFVNTPELQVMYADKATKLPGVTKDLNYLELFKARTGQSPEVVDEKEGKTDTAKSTTYQLRVEGQGAALRFHVTVVKAEAATYVIELSCLEDTYNSHQAEFVNVARSFHLIEAKKTAATESPSPGKAKAGTRLEDNPDAERKFLDEQIKKAEQAGWKTGYSPSKRYLFIYNAEEPFVRELMWRIEGIRDHYEKLYPATRKISAVSIVRVCKNIDDYHAYGGPPSTGGYWLAANHELVFFDNKTRDRDLSYTVLCHEGFHQYIYYFYDNLAPHSWYNEGNGDYFGGADLVQTGNTGKVAKIGMLRERRDRIKEAIQKGSFVPLKDIFQFTQQQYYQGDRIHTCYAEGWSIVYFLRDGLKKYPKNEKWEAILPSYLKTLQEAAAKAKAAAASPIAVDEDEIRQEAFKATFKDWTDDDWKKFQDAWLRFDW
ncbi:MAG: hypothetical protein U1E76_07545 [Planctomycetota bacterium]